VHFNLHAKDQDGIVINVRGRRAALVPAVTLRAVEFHVSAKGVDRIRDRGQREVCAWAWGTIVTISSAPLSPTDLEGLVRVRFNPHRDRTFIDPSGRPVEHAPKAIFASLIEEKEPGKSRPYGYAWTWPRDADPQESA